MSNPFDNQDGSFLVLANAEGEHSLWPAFIAIPGGWSVIFPENSRAACLDYVREHWADLQSAAPAKSPVEAAQP